VAPQQSFSGTIFSCDDDSSTILGSPMAGSASEHQLLVRAQLGQGQTSSDRTLVGPIVAQPQPSLPQPLQTLNANLASVNTASTNDVFEPVLSPGTSMRSMDTYNVSNLRC
jgi:hypothetical protein